MRCPTCSGSSSVRETRIVLGNVTRRTRRCTAGHQFQTFEVLASQLADPASVPTKAAAKRAGKPRVNAEIGRRKAYILDNPAMPPIAIAAHLGCSVKWVYTVRRSNALGTKVRKPA